MYDPKLFELTVFCGKNPDFLSTLFRAKVMRVFTGHNVSKVLLRNSNWCNMPSLSGDYFDENRKWNPLATIFMK